MLMRKLSVLFIAAVTIAIATVALGAPGGGQGPKPAGIEVITRYAQHTSAANPGGYITQGFPSNCEADEVPTGGGWSVIAPGVDPDLWEVVQDHALFGNSDPTVSVPVGWQIEVANGSGQELTVLVWANCVVGSGFNDLSASPG